MKSEKLFVSLHRKWEKNNLKQQPQTTAPDPSKGIASPDPSKGIASPDPSKEGGINSKIVK